MTKAGIFLLLLLLLIPAATAATVTITPATIVSGDTVTVNVQDLSENATFTLGISAEFDVTPGDVFSFKARDLTLPFSLDQGEVNAYTKGTHWTELSAPLSDGGSVVMRYNADENGESRISEPRNLPRGTYRYVALTGETAAGSIVTRMEVTGKKKGPSDGTISFALDGVERGTATVAVYIDGSEALSQRIVIGPSPTPTETAAPSSGGSSGSSGGHSGSSGSTVPGPATTSSADGKASLTGTDIDGAGLLALAVEGTVPAGWSAAGRAYAVTPADRTFASPAVLSFRLPAPETPATIARYENGAWSMVPSKIEGDQITTTVSRGGSYALLVPAAPDPTTPAVATTAAVTTAADTPATPTAAATPLSPLLPVIALALLLLGWGRRL